MRDEAIEFLRNLKSSDKLKLFSHVDADGICSLAILIKFLRRRGIIASESTPEYQLTDVPPQYPLETAPVMIFTDLNSDTILNFVNEKSLVVDHHIFEKKTRGVFYNPRETEPSSYIPASYLVYDIASVLEDMENSKWIAAAGVIGDKGELNSEICRKFVDEFDSLEDLQKIADFIYSAFLIDGMVGNNRMVEALISSNSQKDILDDPYFRYCYEEVQLEVQRSERKIERDGIVRFVEVMSRYNIKAIIASMILKKEPNVVVVTYTDTEDFYKLSIRTNTNLNIGNIVKKAAERAGGSGGGHEKAAGARVPKGKFGVFKEEVIMGVEYHGAKNS